MVFEAVVVELLNKFLKQYIENLDTSQLKIGIWGGDVVLKDLKIKSTVFDDLQLPVRVKWGKLGKLALNIPWKNLYSAQVVVNIEELLLVVIPNSEFNYDPVKEEKWAQDRKQAKLRTIEEAKKQGMQTDLTKPNDSFVEKLLTQITKNLQVVIKNIHIRYEDRTTIPGSPFSVGVTLCNLSALTTLTDPTMNFSKMMKENENFICKVVNLEGLAIYWNSSSVLFAELPTPDLVNAMIESIPRADYKPDGFLYIFGPLSASGFVRLNPKPELDGSDFKIPKIFINIHLKEIDLALTHNQFCDALAYLEDFHRFVAATKYRKYRPVGIPVIGHAREWWHFAYVAVLEDITRRRNEWSWTCIMNHRKCCRRYSELFKMKLKSKKLTADEAKELVELEKKLNVFNLVLIREQVYVEVERTVKEHKSGGWFSGWFGHGTEAKPDPQSEELVKKIQSVMTKQEKQKLYKAIGYEESAAPTNYPIEFVEVQFWFHLDEIKTTVYDDRTKHLVKLMTLSVRSVRMEFEQRPSASAMKFVMIIGNFQVIGKQEADASYPEMVTSNCKESESLIELLYETKPLNATCDQRVIVYARPLSIIYHANTITLVREVFYAESAGEMEKIVAATSASLPTFQRITSLGLQYAIEKRTELEVKVNIMSSYLIIPYGGIYRPGKDMLVLLLGKLSIETEESDKTVNVKQLHLQGTTDEEIFSTIVSASYTKFKCNLTGVQILYQLSGEDWVAASKMQRSALQFLEPTNLEVTIKKSLVVDDARIPKMIIEGKMPSLVFNFQEERFLNFVALLSSIPTRSEESVTVLKKGVTASTWSIQSLGTQLESKLINMQKDLSAAKSTEYVQGIDLVGQFEMKELTVNISKTKGPVEDVEKLRDSKMVNYPGRKFLSLKIVKMEMEITQKTFEVIHLFKLGGIEFLQYHNRDWLPFVSTKPNRGYLFIVEFIKLDTKIPDFYTTKGGIVNRLTLNITPLKILLEREALLAQIEFVTNVQRRVELVRENVTGGHLADAGRVREIIFEETPEIAQPDKKVIAKGKRFRKKTTQKEVIDFFVQVSLDEIDILVKFKSQGLAEFNLKGASIDISTQKSYMTVDAKIQEIQVLDLHSNTKHPKIVASLEEQTLTSRVTLYNKEYFGSENSLDMSIEAEVGGIQCTYVSVFLSRAIEYLNAFQYQVQSIKEGATIAAQKAKENVVKAFHNAAEICLKIKITAPLLLIPETSDSLETLAVDLGVLTIKNSIAELDYTPEAGTAKRPLIDTTKVHLDNLKISSCTLSGPDMAPENERTLLVPVTFELNVKRNLSKSWFTVIPELEIVARLASVHVTLTHEDLCGISNVLRRNLEEGEQATHPDTVRGPSSASALERRPLNKRKEEKIVTHSDLAKDLEEVTGDKCQYSTVVKFMFFMDSFVFDALYTPEKKENETGLARFVLEAMSLKGRIYSDNSMHTSVMLVSCLLDDTRPGKEGRLTRLMERTLDPTVEDTKVESNRTNSMIELIYYKKDKDCFIDIRIYKFTLILSMDFLQKLGGFFTLKETSAENLKQPVKALDKHVSTPTEMEVEQPTFTVNVRFEKPDIIFVENMDSVNVDALIFHTEMVLKYRLAGTKQVISGTLRDIELYSCCFNPLKRPHTMNQVIKPFTVSVAGSTPEGSGLHVDICVSDIFIRIDPSTVDLIAKCHEALLKDSSINKEDEEEEDYSDLWDVKEFSPNDYWFLKPEVGEDALSTLKSPSSGLGSDNKNLDEICLLAIPSISILLEGVQTSRAQPLILLEMGFQMRCYNWSQRLTILKTLTLQMKYFNNIVSNWEPVIEPVEKFTGQNKQSYIPWEINCSIVFGDEGELDELRPPKVQITVSCPEILQVTVTKTCLDVLKKTINKYTTAVTKHVVKKLPDLPPYVVKNETGIVAELLLEESKLQVCRSLSKNYSIVKLDSNSEVELQNIPFPPSEVKKNVSLSDIKKETVLFVKFSGAKEHKFELPLSQPSLRCYPFPAGTFKGSEPWALVSAVSVLNNSTTVILRSNFSIINYFNEPINVHSLSEDGKVAEYVGAVEGNSKFHVPFQTVYNANKKLFFSVNGYSLSIEPFDWSVLKDDANASSLLQCTSKAPENTDPFFIRAVGEVEAICHRSTNWKTGDVVYKLHLQPTVSIFNSLPQPLVICFQGSAEEKLLQPGNKLQMTNAEPGTTTVTLRLSDYLEKEWSCKETIVENPPEFFTWNFVSYNGLSPESLLLGVHVTFTRKTAVYAIYCPFFMINKTEQLLSYKFDHSSAVFHHPSDLTVPVMFSPTAKKFFNKKSACLKVGHSSWSDKFPVDVAGSGGIVECKQLHPAITYKIAVSISLTYNSLTKVVVFSPFYVMINSLEYAIEYQECGASHQNWLEIPPQSCIPFWPQSQSKKKIQVRPKGSNKVSPPFAYHSTDVCLLRLSHKWGGICAKIKANQSGTYITFSRYEVGQAPALIINYSEEEIPLCELNTDSIINLSPSEQVMYSWLRPTGERKLYVPGPKNTKTIIPLNEDVEGMAFTEVSDRIRYVSFLDGAQRVLLFTQDLGLSRSISNIRLSSSGVELICKLQGFGFSLVNDISRIELLYLTFISSGIAWETKKSGKHFYKKMKDAEAFELENAYQKYEEDAETNSQLNPVVSISDKFTVDFEKMQIITPHFRELRRTFEPGFWAYYRQIDDQIMLHVKINRIQVDSQLLDTVFPVILAPIPPPKTVAYQGLKPFFELSLVKIATDRSGVEQYKYFKTLIQEFHVKMDVGFIQHMYSFLTVEEVSDEQDKILFLKDLAVMQQPLKAHVDVVASHEQKNFYDLLHFSPLKIHFSFSMAGKLEMNLPPTFSVLLQSLGVTLTDINDVTFRLSFLERKSVFLTNKELIHEVFSHYYGQIIRQGYVLLLGLDVIGSPYGLIVGIGEGVEAFFYEPIQGMIQGPSEFGKGMALGWKSLFDHTVGSAAGSLGKITGTLGKGLAVLSLDKEYQMQRMVEQSQQGNLQSSMAQGGRSLVLGVLEGVTGVVQKPVRGAKEEGVGGFFKGMGKGMMGLVTRPVTGIVDFASTSLNAVMRATVIGAENKRLRPPRYFRSDTIVEPYNTEDAHGFLIFYSICRRKYCATDKYEYHSYLREKEVVVLTNKRIILAEYSEVFGSWQEHMAITWSSMPERPRCHTKGVALTMPAKPGVLKKEIKVLLIDDESVREIICKKMVQLYNLDKEQDAATVR